MRSSAVWIALVLSITFGIFGATASASPELCELWIDGTAMDGDFTHFYDQGCVITECGTDNACQRATAIDNSWCECENGAKPDGCYLVFYTVHHIACRANHCLTNCSHNTPPEEGFWMGPMGCSCD